MRKVHSFGSQGDAKLGFMGKSKFSHSFGKWDDLFYFVQGLQNWESNKVKSAFFENTLWQYNFFWLSYSGSKKSEHSYYIAM